ncbi:Thioredoxin-like [Neorhodopirellula lusitana]|uniref:Thioredoxin-like n=1 Tax=Neorhodopirellula lusitana TaxID=445327 RepID=A0ABY1QAB9_9BACT|nr:thioredoxin family protein [Neorhodopirellula lusitana]SMP61019.1 Thioredoxin-like [Neorhodopirellula lusitana]
MTYTTNRYVAKSWRAVRGGLLLTLVVVAGCGWGLTGYDGPSNSGNPDNPGDSRIVEAQSVPVSKSDSSSQGVRHSSSDNHDLKRDTLWHHSEEEAFKTSAKLGLPVLIDFAASWCVPCQMMDEHTWPVKEVQDILLNEVVPLRIEMDSGITGPLVEKYAIESVPAVLLVDSDGVLVERAGYVDADEVAAIVHRYQVRGQADSNSATEHNR